MVAIIRGSASLSRTLNYNEQKCRQGQAELIDASGFIKDLRHMNFYDKLNRFKKLNALNERTKINTMHVSLNFDPSEKLDNETLTAIAHQYMEQIGFGEQPYLVYRHDDAGHPHMHIVASSIRADGRAISMHNLGKNKSEPARKSIEAAFNLVRAGRRKNKHLRLPVHPPKLHYGKSELKRSIQSVLAAVIDEYKYTTLGELNAVLGLYNVTAERGSKQSHQYRHGGLVYRALDEDGKPAGPPLKASRFYMQPTLKRLEEKFVQHAAEREKYKDGVRQKIDEAFHQSKGNMANWPAALAKKHIIVVLRRTADDRIYGITYIDQSSKTVFNGSALGKAYSANAIEQQFKSNKYSHEQQVSDGEEWKLHSVSTVDNASSLMDVLLEPFEVVQPVPWPWRRKKKNRKRRSI